MDDEQKARSRDDCLPEFGKMSLAEVGLASGVASSCTGREPAAPVVNFVLRHSGLERRGMTKNILPFPLSTCPTAAETSLSLEVGRAQLGQAEEEEAMEQQLLGHGQHLSVFTLCWIQALSTVLCHGQFICGVAPARLFACDEF